jgi:GNAT superfamily N-acetyltransferase
MADALPSQPSDVMTHVSRARPSDLAAVLPFRAEMYGAASVYNDPGYLRWLYEQAPGAATPRLWLYRDGGQIRAHQGALPVTLKVGSASIDAQWSLDVMIHPSHRRRGIGSAMQRLVEDECQLTMGFEVSGAAQAACRKAGWSEVGAAPLYVRPFRLDTLLEHHHVPTVVARGARRLGRRLEAPIRVPQGLHGVHVQRPDDAFDALWRDVSPTLPVAVQRDARFLRWRFHAFPEAGRYACIKLCEGERMLGYVVLRLADRDGRRIGYLVDYLCAPQRIGDVLAFGLAELQRRGADAAHMVHLSPSFSAADMLALGFVPRGSRWRLLVRDHKLAAGQQALLRDRSQWHLTLADSDADRPREGIAYA